MRLRSLFTMAVGATAAATGLASPASADSVATPTPPQIHDVTAQQAQKTIAAARAQGVTAWTGRRALVRSAGAVIPDASGSHSIPNDCEGSWFVYGGRGASLADAQTNVQCFKNQSMLANASLSRDRFYGWQHLAANKSFSPGGHGNFAVGLARWRCLGTGTYTYRNRFSALTHNGGIAGTIESRFKC